MTENDMGSYRRQFSTGEVLVREAESGPEFYLLEKGVLDVYIHGKKINSIDAEINQDFVGEVGAFLGTPRTATVVAATDCIVLCLPKMELETVLKISPSLGIKLIRSLCDKLFNSASTLAEFQVKHASILNSGNTEISIKNYMKGVLHYMESAARDQPDSATGKLLEYFRETNPWGMQQGDPGQVMDLTESEKR
jgi:signal-transduction protein with cAMP-binding, CBS, and nucleotidyltransferase domain